MVESVHLLSLDKDNRRFVLDEVFIDDKAAEETIVHLINSYQSPKGPFVYAIQKDGQYIGHIQLVKIESGYEVGYHIGKPYVGSGYATEALLGFLPIIKTHFGLSEVCGVCDADNIASRKVLEKAGFIKQYEGLGTYHGREIAVCRYQKILD
jgi:RimJ/RimL family protein N-acetyltransferase